MWKKIDSLAVALFPIVLFVNAVIVGYKLHFGISLNLNNIAYDFVAVCILWGITSTIYAINYFRRFKK